MRRFKSSLLILLLSAICLPQSATQLVTPEIRRVGDRLACKCGSCNNTVATCQMLECHYSYPARQRIAEMLKQGKTDDEIVAAFVQQEGLSALAAPPAEGFNLLGWIMPWIGVGLGLVIVAWFVRRYKPKSAPAAAAPVEDETLARYRDRIDKDLEKLD